MSSRSDAGPDSIDRRLEEIADLERRDRRALARTVLLLLLWPVLGLLGMAWGFQMNDALWGQTIFLGSAAIANAGIVITLIVAYRRTER